MLVEDIRHRGVDFVRELADMRSFWLPQSALTIHNFRVKALHDEVGDEAIPMDGEKPAPSIIICAVPS